MTYVKRICVFIITAVIMLVGTACLDPVQPESYAYVFAIGVDKGEHQRYKYSFMVQKVGQKSDSGAMGSSEIISAEGDTVFEAINIIHGVMSGEVNFMRTSVVVFSETVAKAGGAEEFSKISFNSLRMRQSVKLLAAKGTALDFMKNLESEYRQNLTRIQVDLVMNNRMGILPITSFSIMTEDVNGGRSDPVLTLCAVAEGAQEGKEDAKNTSGTLRTGGTDSYVMGSALFDGWYMKGSINENDTMYLLMAKGQFENGYFTYETSEKKIASLLLEKKADVKTKVDMKNRTVKISVPLYCTVELDETSLVRDEWEKKYRREVEEKIKLQLDRIAQICRELNCDAIGIGDAVSMQFYSSKEWEKYEWKKQYPNFRTEFTVSVELKDKNIMAHMD